MSTTPRYPEHLDVDVSPAGSVCIIDDIKRAVPFVDMTARVTTDDRTEYENVVELVRRFNQHGKLVDMLKYLANVCHMSAMTREDVVALLKEAEVSE